MFKQNSSLTSTTSKPTPPSSTATTSQAFSSASLENHHQGNDKKKFISRYQHTRHNIKQTNKQNNLEELQKKKMSLEVLQSGFKKMSNIKSSMYHQVMDELHDEELLNIKPITTASSSAFAKWQSEADQKQPSVQSTFSSSGAQTNNHSNSSNRERSRRFLESLDIFNENAEKFSSASKGVDVITKQQDIEEQHDGEEEQSIDQSSITDLDEKELEQEIASLDQQLYGLNTIINDSFKNDEPQLDMPYKQDSHHSHNEQQHHSPRTSHTKIHLQENHHPSPYKEEKEKLFKLDRLKELIEYKKELDRREVLIERLIIGLRKENQMHRYKLKEVEKFCSEFSWSQDNLLEDIKRNLFSDSDTTLKNDDEDKNQH
ncbi:hypothetical protein C9374_003009 [Naegleria lovaniensis]|uniref:Uncharacterized protein n=1 Tax=Naegleria lovaniensis TaxID=51637 RepID=A0AA88GS52_NAELO|nr:uncharacterized protein C9374_003009 [Naegleria lovaniensis]KAG2385860.1 hypothetical protein C9374_003009 [Naegleria lovaniensis]